MPYGARRWRDLRDHPGIRGGARNIRDICLSAIGRQRRHLEPDRSGDEHQHSPRRGNRGACGRLLAQRRRVASRHPPPATEPERGSRVTAPDHRGAAERIADRLERADERGTGMRLAPDEVLLLAAAARTAGLREELIAYDNLEDPVR